MPFYPFLGEGSLQNRLQNKGYPYSRLSTGGPSLSPDCEYCRFAEKFPYKVQVGTFLTPKRGEATHTGITAAGTLVRFEGQPKMASVFPLVSLSHHRKGGTVKKRPTHI